MYTFNQSLLNLRNSCCRQSRDSLLGYSARCPLMSLAQKDIEEKIQGCYFTLLNKYSPRSISKGCNKRRGGRFEKIF